MCVYYQSSLDLLLLGELLSKLNYKVRVYNANSGFSTSKDFIATSLPAELKRLTQKGIASPKDTIYLIHSSHIAENPILISDILVKIHNMIEEDNKTLIICGDISKLTDYCQKFFRKFDDDNFLKNIIKNMSIEGMSNKELLHILKHGGYLVLKELETAKNYEYIKQKYFKVDLLEKIESEIDFTLVGGWKKAKEFFNSILKPLYQKKPDIKLPNHILLKGRSGTGKTMFAKAVAKEFNLPLYKVDIGRVYNKYVGSSEENIRRLWKEIKLISPAVILFDELEKMLAGYSSSEEVDAGTTARLFSYILYELQEHDTESIIIATLNREDNLPEELLRKGRWDAVFETNYISIQYIEEVIKATLKRYGIKFSYNKIKRYLINYIQACYDKKLTGADIDYSIRMGIYKLIADDKRVSIVNLLGVLNV